MDKKLKIALAQLNPLVGDVSGNIEKLISIRSNLNNDIDILVAPELYVSGYPIDDLVLREDFLNLVESEINKLVQCTKDNKSAIIVGAPRKDNNHIKNSVFVIENGNIVSKKSSDEMYRHLTRIYWDDEALSQIPNHIQVASKQGAVNKSRSEVVLVNSPSGDYVFCIITNNQSDESWSFENEGFVLIRKISRLLWNYYQ